MVSPSPLRQVVGKAAVPAPSCFRVTRAERPASGAGRHGIALGDLLTEYAEQGLRQAR
jgi:hypothetical protein